MSQHNRGSSFHLLQWTRLNRVAFAESLTRLINLPNVAVAPNDWWRPDGDNAPVEARTESLPDTVLSAEQKAALRAWWLRHPDCANTPNWDFIGTATLEGRKGLVLIMQKYTEGVFPANLFDTKIRCAKSEFYFGIRAMNINDIGAN